MYESPQKRAKFVDCMLVKSLMFLYSVHFQDRCIFNLLSCNFIRKKSSMFSAEGTLERSLARGGRGGGGGGGGGGGECQRGFQTLTPFIS